MGEMAAFLHDLQARAGYIAMEAPTVLQLDDVVLFPPDDQGRHGKLTVPLGYAGMSLKVNPVHCSSQRVENTPAAEIADEPLDPFRGNRRNIREDLCQRPLYHH